MHPACSTRQILTYSESATDKWTGGKQSSIPCIGPPRPLVISRNQGGGVGFKGNVPELSSLKGCSARNNATDRRNLGTCTEYMHVYTSIARTVLFRPGIGRDLLACAPATGRYSLRCGTSNRDRIHCLHIHPITGASDLIVRVCLCLKSLR